MAKAKEEEKATFSKPASLVDLEERQARDNESNRKVHTAEGGGAHSEDDGKARDYGENAGDDAYLGVNPEYAVYANETEKPGRAEKGPEKVLEDEVYDNLKSDESGAADTSGESSTTPAGDPSATKKTASPSSSTPSSSSSSK